MLCVLHFYPLATSPGSWLKPGPVARLRWSQWRSSWDSRWQENPGSQAKHPVATARSGGWVAVPSLTLAELRRRSYGPAPQDPHPPTPPTSTSASGLPAASVSGVGGGLRHYFKNFKDSLVLGNGILGILALGGQRGALSRELGGWAQ